MRFLPVTLNSLLVELADLDETLALLASLQHTPLAGVEELVPAARTILVRYRPSATSAAVCCSGPLSSGWACRWRRHSVASVWSSEARFRRGILSSWVQSWSRTTRITRLSDTNVRLSIDVFNGLCHSFPT